MPARHKGGGREAALRAAHKLFYRDGIGAISVDAIAEEAGLTKRAIYYHFPDKDALVDAYLAERAELSLSGLIALAGDGPSGPARLKRIFDNLGLILGSRGFKGCAMQRAAAQSPRSEPVVMQYQQDLLSFIANELADGGTPKEADMVLARQLRQIANGALAESVSDDPGAVGQTAREAAGLLLAPRL